MILKSLTIENFGIYKGSHTVDLSVSEDKPIILFGGLNGGGKTTFLDALQLVLYGKHARCSNRGHQAFGTYLASTMNRYADSSAAVNLTLEFTHRTDTAEQRYKIQRSWIVAKQVENTKDKVHVFCNDEHDAFISSKWDEFVNEFIPQTLSDLFFFDGEKIENLAHPERSSELIQTGLESLLGLDLLTQLHADLSNIERERKTANIDQAIIRKVSDCEADIGEHDAQLKSLRNEIAELDEESSTLNIRINKVRQKVRDTGAHLIEERDRIKFELGAIDRQLKDNLQQRVKLDAGAGPLGLISGLLAEAEQQIQLESKAKQSSSFDQSVHTYEEQILKVLNQGQVDSSTQAAINALIDENRQQRKTFANTDCYINLPDSIFTGLNDRISTEQAEREKLLKQRADLKERQALFEKQEEAIPDYNDVKDVLTELAVLEAELNNKQTLLEHKHRMLEQALAKRDVLNTRYTNLLTQQNKDTFEQKRSLQVSEHIDKLKSTMHSFAKTMIKENIQLLEQKIAEKFIALTRKDNLISSVLVNTDSFALTLLSRENEILSPERLSAGERQLLAIAILWALAEASGKELPTVIDTPLGRLDGKHRSKLIDNYFPNAAKQVLLLSTDEEITGQYYQNLKPAISREYQIAFNEPAQTSTISEGYFHA
ncbi:DNA sulfur modification protein DndD [Neptuniibacter sp. SY11_33]|uniref:DNA sulfur modification protein DndD n=1 Tax=Neptuniibacter sp. SY11_33 TaxID=3398215 RepID=UPI0039F56519